MRILFVLMLMIASGAVKAQVVLPLSYNEYAQRQSLINNIQAKDSAGSRKWLFSTYSGISTSFSFFKGGNATVISAPLGIQVSRRINNNLYAFAGVSVAPAYVNFNSSFLSANIKSPQYNSSLRSNSLNMYSRAEMGLMYINDQRTFSISGSISVERSSYPVMPYYPVRSSRSNNPALPN